MRTKEIAPLGLYLHIPFCKQKCAYCDFLSAPADADTIETYVQALCEEIRTSGEALNGPKAGTVFFGGGTPSILEEGQLRALFSALEASFLLAEDAEISLEVNPGTADRDKLDCMRNLGVNRLSIGCQAMQDPLLRRIGRIHDHSRFLATYEAARAAGFSNINLDLIFALPGQSLKDWIESLEEAAKLSPEHLSCYGLILEEGTPFFAMQDALDLPDEETERAMYECTAGILEDYGYAQYEISNYARDGFRCRHNIGYWDASPYLGLGLGAASYLFSQRFSNTRELARYLDLAGEQKAQMEAFVNAPPHEEITRIGEAEQMAEFMILGLRMTDGVTALEFEERFGRPLEAVYGAVLKKHSASDLLSTEDGNIRLTRRGLSLANLVMQDFLQDAPSE